MNPLDKSRPDRSYPVRAQALPKVQQALNIEQANRQKATGKKVPLMSIVADLLENAADVIIKKG